MNLFYKVFKTSGQDFWSVWDRLSQTVKDPCSSWRLTQKGRSIIIEGYFTLEEINKILG